MQLIQEVGKTITPEDIMEEIVANANYVSLISKEETINTVRLIELLSEAETAVHTMMGKDLILFYGMTGVGKSTSVNYFIGMILENFKNNIG
jgi:Tfp pilus assembly pilus retraction ATPase PilT